MESPQTSGIIAGNTDKLKWAAAAVVVLLLGRKILGKEKAGLNYYSDEKPNLRKEDLVDEEVEETVKVHGAKFQFTKTKGGIVVPGIKDAVKFYSPLLLQIYFLMMLEKKTFTGNTPRRIQLPKHVPEANALLLLTDFISSEDWANPSKKTQNMRTNRIIYRLPLYAWAIIEMYTTFKAIKCIVDPQSGLKTVEKVRLWLMVGGLNAFGINVAHELLHKASKFEKFLAYMLLGNVNYMHWFEEHITGHHEHVATPKDPATARLNETIYQFIPRTIIGSFLSAKDIERRRLEGLNIKEYSIRNRILWCAFLPFVWSLIIARLTKGGWRAIGLFYFQGLHAAAILEVVNYVEHYGLQRKKLEDGSFEPVDPTHSWNAPHRVSNILTFKLQRHSDHHTYPMRPYQLLRNFKESPQLPAGYTGMTVLAMFPTAFFWVMNPLIDAHTKHKNEMMEKRKTDVDGFSYEKSEALQQAEEIAQLKVSLFSGAVIAGIFFIRSRVGEI